MRIQLLTTVGVLLAVAVAPEGAAAATATTTFPVSAIVLKVCSVSANALAFGNYDPTLATDNDASTTAVVTCTVGTSYQVGLNAGTSSGATVATRKMASGANLLNYGIYQNAARISNWGNTPGIDTPPATTASVTPDILTLYGRVPAGQNVPLGTYNDTITVAITY